MPMGATLVLLESPHPSNFSTVPTNGTKDIEFLSIYGP